MVRVFITLFVLMIFPGTLQATERILDFDVTATVNADASVTVTERLRILVRGEQIRHGIIRSPPHRAVRDQGTRQEYEPRHATLNGKPVPVSVEQTGSRLELRLGSRDIVVPPGEHVYEISYAVTGQIRFFDDHDEFYWNVTGHDWAFAIDRASFRLVLPGKGEEEIVGAAAYTGFPGDQGRDFLRDGPNTLVTTRPLNPGEGFTVAVGWKKGLILPPTPPASISDWIREHRTPMLIGFAGLVAIYYGLVWFRLGRDPRRGTVIPIFAPPENMEPGYTRFVRKMGFSPECFASDLLYLAVKGLIRIEDDGQGLILHRRFTDPDATDLSSPLRAMLCWLFPNPEVTSVSTETGSGRRSLYHARQVLSEAYAARGTRLFSHNLGPGLAGLILFLPVPYLLDLADSPLLTNADALDQIIFLIILTLGFALMFTGLAGLREGLGPCRSPRVRLAMLGGSALLAGVGVRLVWSDLLLVPVLMGSLLLALAVAATGILALASRTEEGVRQNDLVEGLAIFLSTAEQGRLEMLNPPAQTPELFEKLLPYAFALDCAETWANRFQDILRNARYEPQWQTSPRNDRLSPLYDPGFAVHFARIVATRAHRGAKGHVEPATASRSKSASGSALRGGGVSGGGGGGGGRGW